MDNLVYYNIRTSSGPEEAISHLWGKFLTIFEYVEKVFLIIIVYRLCCTNQNQHNAIGAKGMPLRNFWKIRHVPTMKTMCIGGELIHIVWIHTECAHWLQCTFSQSTSIGGLRLV